MAMRSEGIGVGDDRTSVVWDVLFSAGWQLLPKPNHVGAQQLSASSATFEPEPSALVDA
jgi:hypothetical protein